MNRNCPQLSSVLILLGALLVAVPVVGHAQVVLPGPADIDRLPSSRQPEMPDYVNRHIDTSVDFLSSSQPPAGAEEINFVVKNVSIQGAKVFSDAQLEDIYEDALGKQVSLAKLWDWAEAITKRYREQGYFLSRAFVPAQEVEKGRVLIRVVEGYVGEVEFEDKTVGESRNVQALVAAITAKRPTNIHVLESQHLLLRDLPGLDNYQGTLVPMAGSTDGAVKLIFASRKIKTNKNFISLDNYGSRYLGPYQATLGWKGEILPMQETAITGVLSIPTRELGAINATQRIALSPSFSMEFTGGITRSNPGYVLTAQDIDSRAINAGLALRYQVIRQRQENLSFSGHIDARNSISTILNTPLTKDRVRALRLEAMYDLIDRYHGYNVLSSTFSHGINGLGASDTGDLNLSRSGAKPDFSKLQVEYRRLQVLTQNWSGVLTLSGQKSNYSLYSSEEFGFGGQNLGRAYDQSEITGDEGIAGGLEIRYQGIPEWERISLTPFAFYDIGRVWNNNLGQEERLDASSAGAGIRLNHDSGLYGSLQVAAPLTKTIDTPLYGSNSGNPRIGLLLGYQF